MSSTAAATRLPIRRGDLVRIDSPLGSRVGNVETVETFKATGNESGRYAWAQYSQAGWVYYIQLKGGGYWKQDQDGGTVEILEAVKNGE